MVSNDSSVFYNREQVASQVQQPEQFVCKKQLFVPYIWEVDIKCEQHEFNSRPSSHSTLT